MSDTDAHSHDRTVARNRFLAACSLAGAATTAYRSPKTDDTDEAVWLDIARLGSPDAPNVLVLSCGLNGDDGFCGSTVMTAWLSQGRQRDIPRNVGLLMLHAVLPAGTAAGSAPVPERTPPRSWSDTVLSAASKRFAAYVEMTGLKPANDASEDVASKANTTWLSQASDALVEEILEHARHVAVLEFHTGLQPYGDVSVSSCHPAGSPADQRVGAWFGENAHGGEPAILDLFALGFGSRLTDLTMTAAHIEFGVYTTHALLQLNARQSAAQRHEDMRSLFAPGSESWNTHVGAEGTRVIGQALQGLAGR